MTDWAINLASSLSQNNSRRRQNRPRQFRQQDPPIASPRAPPIVPNPDIPRINQARPDAQVYPSIRQNLPQLATPRTANPPTRRNSTSSDEILFEGAQGVPIVAHYPETIYVSEGLPTRTPRELRAFQEHCRLQYQQNQVTLVLDQPLNRLREIATSPLNFQGFLWRSRTTVTYLGIFEEYCWIRRQVRHHAPDHPILQPAYKVHYKWNEGGWIVTRLPRNHQ